MNSDQKLMHAEIGECVAQPTKGEIGEVILKLQNCAESLGSHQNRLCLIAERLFGSAIQAPTGENEGEDRETGEIAGLNSVVGDITELIEDTRRVIEQLEGV